MFKFNKDIGYALISLVDMCGRIDDEPVSARELSDRYSIPFKLLARVLQKLGADGVINSVQGPRGGYRLAMEPQNVRLGRILKAVRGEEFVADCLAESGKCAQENCGCNIKPIIHVFQDRWVDFVENTTLDDFVKSELSRELDESATAVSEL